MKLKKHVKVLAVALALAMMVPQAALAAETTASQQTASNAAAVTEQANTETQKPAETQKPVVPTTAPTAAPTATPEPEPTPEPEQDKWDGTWGTLTSYTISSGTGGTALDTSNLTLEFYFNRENSNIQAVPDMMTEQNMSVTLASGGAFSAQNLQVETAGKHVLRISGLKYTNSSNTRFEATINSPAYGDSKKIGENIRELYKPEENTPVGPDGEPVEGASSLIIKSSSIGADVINAGDECTLSLTIYATAAGKKNIDDVVVSIQPEKGLVITSGSSTEYIGTMKPGQSKTVSFPMRALADFTEGVSTVGVSVTGVGATTGTTTISVPVRQPDRFEVSRVEVPDTLMVGTDETATVYFVNKGKNSVDNITVQMTGTNLRQTNQNQYFGNLAAGTEDSVELELSAMETGTVEGTITISYEAPSGETVELTKKISVPVEEYVDPWAGGDPGMMEPEFPVDGEMDQSTGMAPWQIALIVVAVAGAVAVVVVVLRKRAAKKKAAQEESDEDF